MSHYNSLEKFNRRISKKAQRDFFIAQWQAFIRGSFTSPEHVTRSFPVTFQTAWNWWHGLCCPMGDEVNLAWMDFPEEARAYLSGGRAA